jgi:hypothetical protein
MSSEPSDRFSIVVTVAPEQRRADLTVSGDMNIPAGSVLADAVEEFAAVAPHLTVVDLAAITFAGSVLLNFPGKSSPGASRRIRPCCPPPTAGNPQNSRNSFAMERLAAIRDDTVRSCAG